MRAAGFETAADLARAANVTNTLVGDLLNLKVEAVTKSGEWRSWVVRIADTLRCLPEDIVPPQHVHARLETNRTERAIGAGELQAMLEARQGDPARAVARQEAIRLLNAELDKLPDRQRDVLRRRFGLETGQAEYLEDVAKAYGVTRERVRQIELRALHALAEAGQAERLKDGLDAFG
jgi:RNA polymerase sigma factor (sigma-70 family)